MSLSAARPVFFGAGPGLFGWLHACAVPSPVALVVCSPFGNEEVLGHRALRHLAQLSAAAGIPALRFDYEGTGDSAGDQMGPGRVDAWIASVHAAVDAAKRLTGAHAVCLLGVRLGATLAATAALSRDDVIAMAAIAPVVQGRAYVRELKVMSRTAAAADETTVPVQGLLESSHFVLSPPAADAVAQLNLLGSARPPARRMLVIDRDDLPASPAWTEHLRRSGADVTACVVPGYIAFVGSEKPGEELPVAMFKRLTAWLGDLRHDCSACPAGVPDLRAGAPALAAGPGVREEAVRIPAGDVSLFGMLSAPVDWRSGARPGMRAVLLVPAGLGRRIGRGRVYVELARRLAAQGHVVLRIDVSGVGDSPPHAGFAEHSLYEFNAVDDIAAALDYLRRVSGVPAPHLVGHCMGAYNAFRHVAAGGTVAALIQINPQVFSAHDRRTLRGTVSQPLSTRPPAAAAAGGSPPAPPQTAAATPVGPGLAQTLRSRLRQMPALKRAHDAVVGWRFRRELRRVARRNIHLHFVFGTLESSEWRMQDQAGAAVKELRRRGQLSITHMPGSDHVITHWHHRQQLVEMLVDWVTRDRAPPQRSAWFARRATRPLRGPQPLSAPESSFPSSR